MSATASAHTVVLDETVPARAPWAHPLLAGQSLRIVDLGGNQAVDCLFFNLANTDERYSAPDTIAAQRNIFLVTGSTLLSNEGNPMLTVTDTTCAYHDTIGGSCSREVEHAPVRPPHLPPARVCRELPGRRLPLRTHEARSRRRTSTGS